MALTATGPPSGLVRKNNSGPGYFQMLGRARASSIPLDPTPTVGSFCQATEISWPSHDKKYLSWSRSDPPPILSCVVLKG